MHRMVTQRTLLGVLGTALLGGSVFAAGPFLSELPTVVISDQMNQADVAANPATPYDPFTAPTRNIYRFTDAVVLADYVFFQDDSPAAKSTVKYVFEELEDNGSSLVPVAPGSQTIQINGAVGTQGFGGTLGDFNFPALPDVVSAGALDFLDVFYTGPDPNNPTNPQGLSDVEGATPFVKRSYISMYVASPNGLDVGNDVFEVITTNAPVYNPEADEFVRYDFATTGPVDTGFLTCELVLDELSNWTFSAGYIYPDYSVVPYDPISVYSSPPDPGTTTATLVNGFTAAGTQSIPVSVDGTASGLGGSGATFLFSPQLVLLSSYGSGSTGGNLLTSPSFANALPGTAVKKDTVYMARATVANTAQTSANVARIPEVRFRLGEAAVAGLGEATSLIAVNSPNHIAVNTTRVHRMYFYALADGTGATLGANIADRNLNFSFDVIDLFTDLLTDSVTLELQKVEILSFTLDRLGAPAVALNQGGVAGVDYTLAAGVPAPPAGAAPFTANWAFSNLIESFPAIAAERVATGTRGAGDKSLSISYQAGNGGTVAGWAGEIIPSVANDKLVVAEYYVSTTHDPSNTDAAPGRVRLQNAAPEGRIELFTFRGATSDTPDAQTNFADPNNPVGLAPGSVTGLTAAARRIVVIMEPQLVSAGTMNVELGADVDLYDPFNFFDITQDPPVGFDPPFFFPGARNGNMTVNGVVVSIYDRPQDLVDFSCP